MWPSSAKTNCRAFETLAVRSRRSGPFLEVRSLHHAKHHATRKLVWTARARAGRLGGARRRRRGVRSREQQQHEHARHADRPVGRDGRAHEHDAARGAQGAPRDARYAKGADASADDAVPAGVSRRRGARDDARASRRHRRGLRRAASASATSAEARRAAGAAAAAVRPMRRRSREASRRALRSTRARATSRSHPTT